MLYLEVFFLRSANVRAWVLFPLRFGPFPFLSRLPVPFPVPTSVTAIAMPLLLAVVDTVGTVSTVLDRKAHDAYIPAISFIHFEINNTFRPIGVDFTP